MRLPTIFALALTSSVLALGCADEEPPKAPPQPTAMPAPKTTAVKDEDIPNKESHKSQIHIGPKLAKLCDIPTAYFAFDSSALSDSAQAALDALAKCFTTGAAKDKGMKIVGHADPRGEPEYNMALGQRRAGSVEVELVKNGVPNEAIESTSRGELDAKGTDEASWEKDRKVDIFLAE